jgi:hypothetical protein
MGRNFTLMGIALAMLALAGAAAATWRAWTGVRRDFARWEQQSAPIPAPPPAYESPPEFRSPEFSSPHPRKTVPSRKVRPDGTFRDMPI